MNDKPIRVGDVVQVVRWPSCGCCLGLIGTVKRFTTTYGDCCMDCADGQRLPHNGSCAFVDDPEGGMYVPLEWLKRIPPIEELDDVKRDEEVTA